MTTSLRITPNPPASGKRKRCVPLPQSSRTRWRKKPSQPDAADIEYLQSCINSRLLEIETIRSWQSDPDTYASGPAYSLFLLMKRNFAPPEDRLRSVVAREKQIPAAIEAGRKNLKNPPRIFTEIALEQLPGTITFIQNDVPAAFSSVKDPKLLAEFRETTKQAVSALQAYETFLKTKLLPASKGDFRLGADTFRKKLLYEEMVDIPLVRLREIGYADLHRNQERLKKTAAADRWKEVNTRSAARTFERIIRHPASCYRAFATL